MGATCIRTGGTTKETPKYLTIKYFGVFLFTAK